MHVRTLLLIVMVLIEGTVSFPLPRLHNPPVPVKRAIQIEIQCSTTPQVSHELQQELLEETCNILDIVNSCGSESECEKVRRCSPSSFSEEDQSAGQLFQELKAKVGFYKNASGPEAAEVCRLDALLNHNELNGFVQSCSRGQSDNQPSVSSANFSSWSELSNTSRSLCLLTSIQTSLFRLIRKFNPNHDPQCNNIKPKIWQAEKMVNFAKSISDQLNQTNTSQCRIVTVTAAEAETTLRNISVLLGISSLNCFSAELNRSIIPIIANLEQESAQTTPLSLDFGENLDSEQLKFCLLKQVKSIMDGQLSRWNVNKGDRCFNESYPRYRTEMSCSN